MANTLTGLIPVLYQAIDVVSRELTGLIPAVTANMNGEAAAKDQTITYPIAPASSASDISPAVAAPDGGDQTIGNSSMTISKSRYVPVRWNGEEVVSVSSLYADLLRDQFAQAMRTLTNEVETDLAALYAKASRAYGTAGTTPFATAGNFTDASEVRRILVDNGAGESDLQLVIDTAAGAKIRGLQATSSVAFDGVLARQGILQSTSGMDIRESAQIKYHTKGTGASYDVDLGAGYAAGSTTVHVDTGTGTILAGDVVSFAGDSNKYLCTTGFAGDGDGDIVLAAPGLRATLADGTDVTIGNSYRANMAFRRSAIHLITRAPAMPVGGDAAADTMLITDPVSGLTFQVCLYRQFKQVLYTVELAWGVKAVKPEHIAILLG